MSRKNRLDKGRINMTLERYKRSSLRERGRIITELCEDYGVKRKAVVRAFARADGKVTPQKVEADRPKRKPGRPASYNSDDVVWWLQTLWVSMRKMNVKAMKEALPRWLPYHPDPSCPEAVKAQILKMSSSTIERLLSSYKHDLARKMRCTTRRPLWSSIG